MSSHETLTEIGKSFQTKTITNGQDESFSYLVANEAAQKVAILIHGVTGNKLDMVVLGREYARRGYIVYAPDLPGHGSAPVLEALTFHDLGDWLHRFIAALAVQPDLIVGNSFAAAICYDFAQQGYLADTTHLILACPTPDIAWSSRALRRAGGSFPSRFATKSYNSKPAIKARVAYLSKSEDPSARQWLVESEYHKIPFIEASVGNKLSMLLETHNPYMGLLLPDHVQRQITIVLGKKDNVVTKKSLDILKKILPRARLVMVPNVGHILHFEAYKSLSDIG